MSKTVDSGTVLTHQELPFHDTAPGTLAALVRGAELRAEALLDGALLQPVDGVAGAEARAPAHPFSDDLYSELKIFRRQDLQIFRRLVLGSIDADF